MRAPSGSHPDRSTCFFTSRECVRRTWPRQISSPRATDAAITRWSQAASADAILAGGLQTAAVELVRPGRGARNRPRRIGRQQHSPGRLLLPLGEDELRTALNRSGGGSGAFLDGASTGGARGHKVERAGRIAVLGGRRTFRTPLAPATCGPSRGSRRVEGLQRACAQGQPYRRKGHTDRRRSAPGLQSGNRVTRFVLMAEPIRVTAQRGETVESGHRGTRGGQDGEVVARPATPASSRSWSLRSRSRRSPSRVRGRPGGRDLEIA